MRQILQHVYHYTRRTLHTSNNLYPQNENENFGLQIHVLHDAHHQHGISGWVKILRQIGYILEGHLSTALLVAHSIEE